MRGIQFGGIYSTNDDAVGASLDLINMAQDFTGLQWGALNWSRRSFTGVQFGLANLGAEVYGLQFGFYNQADSFKGLQLGLVNYVKNIDVGLQVGLVNIINNNGWLPAMVLLNGRF
jgi:hypothetical protein